MEEDQKSTGREGGTLEGADIKELKKQAQVAKAKKEEATRIWMWSLIKLSRIPTSMLCVPSVKR